LILLLGMSTVWGQTGVPLEFEVVSIKPSRPVDTTGPQFFGCRGGPGSSDPGRITCSHQTAGGLVPIAYAIGFLRVSYQKVTDPGKPQFDIVAKVPYGATKNQVQQMWQKLLTDRFKLAIHHETREMPVYELVLAKGGFKAKEWVDPSGTDPAETAPWEPGTLPRRDKDGFPLVPPGQSSSFFTEGKAHFVAPAGTIEKLATMLERRLSLNGSRRPVIDATGLTGKYDLKFWWSPQADANDAAEGPSMLSALESQLGLKVQTKKSAPVEILVIDHLESIPIEN
jgi:uncharacterized protein (TIGR03435 family)